MINQLHYKNYYGNVFFSEEDGVFHGKVLGITDSISFEGESVKELIEDFHSCIDEYLEFCKSVGEKPQESSFSIKLSPELHNMATIYATQKGLSLNIFVEEAIKNNIVNR